MKKLFGIKIGWALALYAFLDILCLGLGMGVPFFNILFGLPVGWYLARRGHSQGLGIRQVLAYLLRWAAITAAFTCLLLAILWGPAVGLLFDPAADLANYGMPLILFEPLASFIGWLVLMILISPALQLLVACFAGLLTLLWESRGEVGTQRSAP